MVLAFGESHPIIVQFMQQSAERAKSVEQQNGKKKFNYDDFQLTGSNDSYMY